MSDLTHPTGWPRLALVAAVALSVLAAGGACSGEDSVPGGPLFRNGKLAVRAGTVGSGAHAMIELPGGRLLLVGFTEDAGSLTGRDVLILQLTADGRRDTSFGTNGAVVVDIGGDDTATAIAPLPDQAGWFVAGYTEDDLGQRNLFVSKHQADGALDATFDAASAFGPAGIVTIDLAGALSGGTFADANDEAVGLVLDTTTDPLAPRLYVAGSVVTEEGADRRALYDGFVLALTTDGTLATDFGPSPLALDGVTLLPFRRVPADDRVEAMTLQRVFNSPTDPGTPFLLVGGSSEVDATGRDRDHALARIDLTGRLDVRFGNANGLDQLAGTWIADAGGDDVIHAVRVTEVGRQQRIIAAGSLATFGDRDLLVIAWPPNANTLDATFGEAGLIREDAAGGEDAGFAIGFDRAGQLLIAGQVTRNGDTDVALYRYTEQGTPAPIALFRADFAGGQDRAHAVLARGRGPLIVAGVGRDISDVDVIAVAMFTP